MVQWLVQYGKEGSLCSGLRLFIVYFSLCESGSLLPGYQGGCVRYSSSCWLLSKVVLSPNLWFPSNLLNWVIIVLVFTFQPWNKTKSASLIRFLSLVTSHSSGQSLRPGHMWLWTDKFEPRVCRITISGNISHIKAPSAKGRLFVFPPLKLSLNWSSREHRWWSLVTFSLKIEIVGLNTSLTVSQWQCKAMMNQIFSC